MNLTQRREERDTLNEERQGPEARRIPPHGLNNDTVTRTSAETTDTPNTPVEPATPMPWAPYGFNWTNDLSKLVPDEAYVKQIEIGAEECFVGALHKFADSAECKTLINTMGNEIRSLLQTRKALNERAYERELKRYCDDAAYQIVQAAKYRIDAEEKMRQMYEFGETDEKKRTIETLRNYAKNNQREGYILSRAVMVACEDGTPPTFDYRGAAQRTTNYSARKLTETLAARAKNQKNEAARENEAFKRDMASFWND